MTDKKVGDEVVIIYEGKVSLVNIKSKQTTETKSGKSVVYFFDLPISFGYRKGELSNICRYEDSVWTREEFKDLINSIL